jgi:uncharacterized protein (TIGR01244 family)
VTGLIPLDESTFVAGQIDADDVGAAAAAGVRLIVNNRPDHEEAGQPTGDEIARAAEQAGLGYRYIPIAGGFGPAEVAAMAAALDAAEGKVLAFCRSGTRSTWLWALAKASRGADGEELIARAAEAGFDLTPLRPYLGR